MPKVNRVDHENLTTTLAITIEQDDYKAKYKEELNKFRKEAHFKGFRKGKTPLGFIRKMYGKSILTDAINEQLQLALFSYLEDNKLNYIGQPIPSKDQEPVEFDPSELKDYEFKFDVGLSPEFEVKELEEDKTFHQLEVKVTEEMIDDSMMEARNRMGETVEVEAIENESDIIEFEALELEEDEPKAEGFKTTFMIPIDRIADEAFKEKVLKAQKGDQFRFNIYNLEKDLSKEDAIKYYLKLENPEEAEGIGEHFEGTITKITQRKPAELDEKFFEGYFGNEEVKTEEEARKFFEDNNSKFYKNKAHTLLWQDMQNFLMQENPVALPAEFLKRWLLFSSDRINEENLEDNFNGFVRGLRWKMIREKLIAKYDVMVTEEEIVEAHMENMRQYFGGQLDENYLKMMAQRFMEDESRVEDIRQDLYSDKLFNKLKEHFTIASKSVTVEEFDEEMEDFRKKILDQQEEEDKQVASDTAESTPAADMNEG